MKLNAFSAVNTYEWERETEREDAGWLEIIFFGITVLYLTIWMLEIILERIYKLGPLDKNNLDPPLDRSRQGILHPCTVNK